MGNPVYGLNMKDTRPLQRTMKCIRVCLAVAAVCAPRSSALAASKRGFASKKKPSSKRAELSGSSKRLLREHEGDIDSASAARYEEYMATLADTDGALFEEVVAARRGAATTRRGRDALTAITWDTVADFVLAGGGGDAGLDARLEAIAAACGRESVLDVGCGDGSLVPFLGRAGSDLEKYAGLDLSGSMIKAARKRHPKRAFSRASFLDYEAPSPFSSVVFSGSLQFFPEPKAALDAASALLGEGGEIVVAHVRGAAFVREERAGNPALVVDLPEKGAYGAWGYDVASFREPDDAFYLAVLRPSR